MKEDDFLSVKETEKKLKDLRKRANLEIQNEN